MRSIVWMAKSEPRTFCEGLSAEPVVVSSLKEFTDAPRDPKTISFLDSTTLAAFDELATQLGADDVPRPEWRKLLASVSLGPVILISSEPAPTAIAGLQPRPWLSHVLSPAMLEHPMARAHLGHVIQAVTATGAPRLMDWMGPAVSGRRVRIANASRRSERLERMSQYVVSKGATKQMGQQLRDVAEEILTNAFYNAPVAAGAVDKPIPRTQDVSLPDESAVDLAYGCDEQLAFIRVRDPFGSLSRARLVDVLSHSARTDKIDVDDSMGGSGFGLRRVFSAAALVAVSVLDNHHTEVLVGIIDGGAAASRPFAFHLFFKDSARRRLWRAADQDTALSAADPSLNNTFVSIVLTTDPK